ncbi:LacI family transcriptional regulator [Paraliobacillus quinghaiensis]|uniref:LacI family transcriptional regulator n=1 Tax=Paraliobacillus quinghaiensis TaxID=470815 RepID=A0A917TEH8_9BACI|nr:LacI family DNA-binding transcriptional regulator [Paraliobacillus quinghaiensis]GGM19710.1 LacI family transcriptional regulator [Paraliobacillus quinghaiensis]
MTNIKDVAKLANVSVTTVSRVLNKHPYVSEEKREAVLDAVKKTNYHINRNAVNLSKGKTFLIGVVLPYSDHPYFGTLLKGIANAALEHNYKLVLIQTNYQKDKEKEAFIMLEQKQIDGLIICSRVSEWEVIEEYVIYGPIVLAEKNITEQVSSTYIDHYQAFYQALNHLYTNGYQSIGYCINRKNGVSSQQRERAYHDFLKEKQIPFDQNYIFDGYLNFEDGERVVQQLKQMKKPPAALIVTSDQVAAGIVTCCHNLGLQVPKDLAIIGFDNQPIAKYMGITTMEIPLSEMGENLFLQAITREKVSQKRVNVQLIERQTV